MSTVIDTLIYDRTQEDVDRVFKLKNKILKEGLASLSDEEKSEYMSGMKGAYNHTDMNRVGQAVSYIAGRLPILGVETAVISPKTDWSIDDTPTQAQATIYISNLEELKSKIPSSADTPDVPKSLDNLTYQIANDIEKLLVNMDDGINRIIQAFNYAGIINCGE